MSVFSNLFTYDQTPDYWTNALRSPYDSPVLSLGAACGQTMLNMIGILLKLVLTVLEPITSILRSLWTTCWYLTCLHFLLIVIVTTQKTGLCCLYLPDFYNCSFTNTKRPCRLVFVDGIIQFLLPKNISYSFSEIGRDHSFGNRPSTYWDSI